MARQLVVEETVVGRPAEVVERFRREPSGWLPFPHEPGRGHHWRTYLWTGDLGVLVDATVAPPFSQNGETRRLLRLEPDRLSLAGRLAPSLEGDLVIRPGERPVVRLQGTYRVPFGPVGAAANAILLHKVAEASAHRFLHEVAVRLGDASSPAVAATA